MPPIPETPTDASKLLPWVITALVVVVGILWRARESSLARENARLEAELTRERAERERERVEHKSQVEDLGARIDYWTQKNAHDQKQNARALLLARSAHGQPADWEPEASTGVRDLLSITGRTLDDELRRFDPYHESTPPRMKLPSRPR